MAVRLLPALLALLPGGTWAQLDDSSGGLAQGACELLIQLVRAIAEKRRT